MYDSVIRSIDQNLYSCCLYIDLSKAFDTANLAILLDKLHNHFGVRRAPYNLLKFYLTNRFPHTAIFNSTSNRNIHVGLQISTAIINKSNSTAIQKCAHRRTAKGAKAHLSRCHLKYITILTASVKVEFKTKMKLCYVI